MKKAALLVLVLVTVLGLALSSSAADEPVKLGLGHVTSIAKSQGLTVDASGKAVLRWLRQTAPLQPLPSIVTAG